jgi:hypothetical protein
MNSSGSSLSPSLSSWASWRSRFSSAPGTSASLMESSRHSTMDTTPLAASLRMSAASPGLVAGL